MRNILHLLGHMAQLNIIVFGERVILDVPIEKWPPCNAMVAFHSGKYPLHKVIAYAKMHKPAVINDLSIEVGLSSQLKAL